MVLSEKLGSDWKKAATIQNLANIHHIKLSVDLELFTFS